MERYNLLIVENEGIRIIQTDAYVKLIQANPSLIHQNQGDFYSEVPVSDLADAVYRSLDREVMGEKGNQDLVIVESLDHNSLDEEKEYLVKEEEGIRIYCPSLHTEDARLASEEYCMGSMMFIEDLFSDKQKGTLQYAVEAAEKDIKQGLKEVQALTDMLRQ